MEAWFGKLGVHFSKDDSEVQRSGLVLGEGSGV